MQSKIRPVTALRLLCCCQNPAQSATSTSRDKHHCEKELPVPGNEPGHEPGGDSFIWLWEMSCDLSCSSPTQRHLLKVKCFAWIRCCWFVAHKWNSFLPPVLLMSSQNSVCIVCRQQCVFNQGYIGFGQVSSHWDLLTDSVSCVLIAKTHFCFLLHEPIQDNTKHLPNPLHRLFPSSLICKNTGDQCSLTLGFSPWGS